MNRFRTIFDHTSKIVFITFVCRTICYNLLLPKCVYDMVLDMRYVGKRGVPHTPHRMTGIPRQAVQLVQQPIEHGLRARPATAQGEGDMKSRTWARSGPKSYKVATHFVKHVYQQNMCL